MKWLFMSKSFYVNAVRFAVLLYLYHLEFKRVRETKCGLCPVVASICHADYRSQRVFKTHFHTLQTLGECSTGSRTSLRACASDICWFCTVVRRLCEDIEARMFWQLLVDTVSIDRMDHCDCGECLPIGYDSKPCGVYRHEKQGPSRFRHNVLDLII